MNRIDRDTYELSTGRRLRANCGILGLDPDKDEPQASRLVGGYDRLMHEGAPGGNAALTHAERLEIAEYQIKLWAEWACAPMLREPIVQVLDALRPRALLRLVTRQDAEAAYGPELVRELLGEAAEEQPTNPDPPLSLVPDRFVKGKPWGGPNPSEASKDMQGIWVEREPTGSRRRR